MSIIDCQLLPEPMDITKFDFLHIHREALYDRLCSILVQSYQKM